MTEEPRQTVAGAYDKIEGHEALCAERYEGIKNSIGDLTKTADELKGTLKWSARGIIALLISILGWALVQLYTLQPLRQTTTATVSTTVSSVRPQP